VAQARSLPLDPIITSLARAIGFDKNLAYLGW